jgi:hypothetical protein
MASIVFWLIGATVISVSYDVVTYEERLQKSKK